MISFVFYPREYINGDNTLEDPKIINAAVINNKIIRGSNHHFFLTFKKLQISNNKDLFLFIFMVKSKLILVYSFVIVL